MSKFISKIKKIWQIFKNATRHQIWLFVGTFIFMFIFDSFGIDVLASVIFGVLVGTIIEIAHCFIPSKQVKLFGETFNVSDFKTFKANWKNNKSVLYNEIDTDDVYFNISAIILFYILKLVFIIIF